MTGRSLAVALLIVCGMAAAAAPGAAGSQSTASAPPSGPAPSAPSSAAVSPPAAMSPDPLGPIPPDDPRMEAYSHGGYVVALLDILWSLALLFAIVVSGFGARLERLAQRVTRRPNLLVAVYSALYVAVVFAGSFPLTVYANFVREKHYGFANQSFAAWLGDQGKSLAVSIVLQALFFVALYAVLRRLPRGWWIVGAGLAIAFVILVVAIAPVFIAPLFNKFEPLRDATLRDQILEMARAQGIPAREVYQVDASRQSGHNNAYVAGLLGTQRIVIYDTLLKNFTPREIRFVMGHEMGHYVLWHIWKLIALLSVAIVAGFLFLDRTARRVVRRFPRLGIASIEQPASLPLLLLLLNLFLLPINPLLLACSRHEEHEADRFGMDVTHDPEAAASSFIKFGTYDLSEYEVDPWIEALLYSHPSPANRIRFAQAYAARSAGRDGGSASKPEDVGTKVSGR